ncbi:hypothetical protein KR054_012645 [Drosophila jambulina]|nr:hypothetical protein KR054_012645 [Drosophila jambulina]
MSLDLVPNPAPLKIYLLTYEMDIPEDPGDGGLLPLVALKAQQLKVCGFIAHTHSGRRVGGELEGSEESLHQMVKWLVAKAQGKDQEEEVAESEEKMRGVKSQMTEPRFSKWKLQSRAKYVDFFQC